MGTNQSAINVSYLKGFAKFMAELVPILPNIWIKQKKNIVVVFYKWKFIRIFNGCENSIRRVKQLFQLTEFSFDNCI